MTTLTVVHVTKYGRFRPGVLGPVTGIYATVRYTGGRHEVRYTGGEHTIRWTG
mgnify:CR=1 FL=1